MCAGVRASPCGCFSWLPGLSCSPPSRFSPRRHWVTTSPTCPPPSSPCRCRNASRPARFWWLLSLSHERLAKTIDEIETGGEAPLSARVEALSKNKNEIEQRLARIDDSANILRSIRLDYEELAQRQAQLERSLTEVETDRDGRTLVDRQNALNDFVLQSRQRLAALQETLATLNAFKTELSKSQADLVPLKAPVFGIEAMIADVSSTRDLLAKTVSEIEASGDVTLTSRVDALAKSKSEVEDRLARIFDNFNALDALRKDIGGIFSTIRSNLNRIG